MRLVALSACPIAIVLTIRCVPRGFALLVEPCHVCHRHVDIVVSGPLLYGAYVDAVPQFVSNPGIAKLVQLDSWHAAALDTSLDFTKQMPVHFAVLVWKQESFE